ncbi:MAG: hypothetical protein R3B93_21065 [Bacteroidia bacterium]
MPHTLIQILGKGQPTLIGNNRLSYRQAQYILPENPETIVETPFIAEAITRLFQEKTFDQIYIFGTKDSM